MSPPHGDLLLYGVSIRASSNLDVLVVKFESKLIFEDHVLGIVFHVSHGMGIVRLVKRIFVDTSVLLRCYFTFLLPILEYCSPVWGSAAEFHVQLLERQVYCVARLCPNQIFLSLCKRRRVAGLSMLYKDNSNSNHSLFSELPSAYTWVRHSELRPQLIHWSLKYQGVERPNLLGLTFRLMVRMWNELLYTVVDTGMLDGFKGAVNHWLLPWVVFSSVFRGAGPCGTNSSYIASTGTEPPCPLEGLFRILEPWGLPF